MDKLVYSRKDQRIYLVDPEGNIIDSWECRDAFWEGTNDEGQPYESLPNGSYTCTAEPPGVQQGEGYGTFLIDTGDPRLRKIHGGGSSSPDPYAPEQGWYPTLGCLRMQNRDGEKLSELIIERGNAIPLEVVDECD